MWRKAHRTPQHYWERVELRRCSRFRGLCEHFTMRSYLQNKLREPRRLAKGDENARPVKESKREKLLRYISMRFLHGIQEHLSHGCGR